MKFITPANDPWRTVVGDDGPMVTITCAPNRLLTLLQWHSVSHHWPTGMPVGVALGNDHDIEDLVPDLPRLGLVVLDFPKWVDGRAYTQAHLLRQRYGFKGEVRATGAVLVDMMPLLQRNGFDAVVLRGDQSREAAERALGFFPGFYQGDVREHRPRFALSPEEQRAQAPDFVQQGASI